jgi:hypothetical protein
VLESSGKRLLTQLIMRARLRYTLTAAFLTLVLIAAVYACTFRADGQDQSDASIEETVADIATGRVVIAVVKGGILVGTVENPIEADTRVPVPVHLSEFRIGVILGAVRWFSPSTHQDIARLDRELPGLHSHLIVSVAGPHVEDGLPGSEASDIEAIGQGLLERLSDVAQNLHAKINLPEQDSLVQLILADYLQGYGPEVWQLSYGVKQEEQRDDYWTTRVLRPAYLQFWPPEKGQPHTLVEFSYPGENAPAPLVELLRQKDPRLEKIVSSDPKMAEVASHILQGEINKVSADAATQFLRAALDAIAPPKARETIAIIHEETGFEWILAPPPEPMQSTPQPNRPPGAPTLMGNPE